MQCVSVASAQVRALTRNARAARSIALYEAFRLHTLDRYEYRWERPDGGRVSDKTIREIVGESIPPAGLQKIIDHLVAVRRGKEIECVGEGQKTMVLTGGRLNGVLVR